MKADFNIEKRFKSTLAKVYYKPLKSKFTVSENETTNAHSGKTL